jgi:hypothetical protein
MFTLLCRILPISLKIKNISVLSPGGYFFGKISLKKKMLKTEILKKLYFPWQNKLNHDCFGTD